MPTVPDPDLDPTRMEAVDRRLTDILNGGALSLAISLGHRAGLFDVMHGLPPATSEAVAGAAGLRERYVREWLAAMVCGGLVEHDAQEGTYRLPPEHAARLTRRADPANRAVAVQFIPMLARVEDDLLACFRDGGGLDYAYFPRFHDVMAEWSSQTVVSALHDAILPLVPDLTRRLERGLDVLDAGCGHGRALVSLASTYPNSRFTGYDLEPEAVAVGEAAVRELRLHNLRFQVLDLAELAETARWDLVTGFDVIHDQAQPATVLANIRRALRPNGVFLMQEIAAHSAVADNADHPLAPFLYTISYNHCMTVSLARGGTGLGTCWGAELATRMLAEAGFGAVERHELDHDPLNHFWIARP